VLFVANIEEKAINSTIKLNSTKIILSTNC